MYVNGMGFQDIEESRRITRAVISWVKLVGKDLPDACIQIAFLKLVTTSLRMQASVPATLRELMN